MLSRDRQNLGVDDAFAILSVLWVIIINVIASISVHYGAGHMEDPDTPPEALKQAIYLSVVSNSLGVWAFTLPKFTLMALLNRVFGFGLKSWIGLGFVVVASFAGALGTSILWWKQCIPSSRIWDPTVSGKCLPPYVLVDMGYGYSVWSAFGDLVFTLYPQLIIMKLNMPKGKKAGFCAAFGLNGLAFAVSIYKISLFPRFQDLLQHELTYLDGILVLLAILESDILIVAGSLPSSGNAFRFARQACTSGYSKIFAESASVKRAESGPSHSSPSLTKEDHYSSATMTSRAPTDEVELVPHSPRGSN
ncbi:MAG: hypothetical protein Q9162_006588 [Coniocarpon cinnabarinum]